ncbi:MAG: Xaa-Pro dipeptidase [Gammaproteobacteria bacterium]|nr:Xaa-Pro dipeptidase [Gammaproteobacteria bacterium]
MTDDHSRYRDHVATLRQRYDNALEQCRLDAVVLAAGQPHGIFLDDQHLPFKPNPHLLQWGPLREHPGSVLIVRAGEVPRLLVYTPTDFWHEIPPVPDEFAVGELQVEAVSNAGDIAAAVRQIAGQCAGAIAFIGETTPATDTCGINRINPDDLLAVLNEFRTVKTDWEIDNLRAASHMGVKGHLAAREAFRGGGTEYEIQLAFRTACNATDDEMPYPAIVALNEHAATLHYQRLDRERRPNLSLLIDAGHAVNGYASDITRTHSDDAEFGALIEAMHELQRDLCTAALPGVNYRELHHAAHLAIAALLGEAGLITVAPEDAVEAGISRTFFPHGLGHFLGLQVHDVGALYTRREPGSTVPEGEDKYLRLTRTLEAGNVLTIEPGIYFIESLLNDLRGKPAAGMIDWARVDALRPFGGIRIEDNLCITGDGHENLTRRAFSALDTEMSA